MTRLPEWLHRDGLLSEAQANALAHGPGISRGELWQSIVDAGWLTDEQVGAAIARRFDLPFRRITRDDVDERLVSSAPREVWENTLTAPLGREGSAIVLACCDPVDLQAFDQVTTITGLHISPVVVPPGDVLAAMIPPAAARPNTAVPEPRRWRIFRTDEPARTLVDVRFDDLISGPTGHVELLGDPDVVTLVEHWLADPFGQRPLYDPSSGYRYGPFFYDPWDVQETLFTLARSVEKLGVEVLRG